MAKARAFAAGSTWSYFRFAEHLAATTIDGTLDRAVAVLVKVLAEGKFIGLFSMLLGFGVATQLVHWQRRGLPWRRLYARRMLALGVIGAVHLVFVWYGDILTTYAVVGVLLGAFVNRSPRTLLRWSLGILGARHRRRRGAGAPRRACRDRVLRARRGRAFDRRSDALEVARLDAIYRAGSYGDRRTHDSGAVPTGARVWPAGRQGGEVDEVAARVADVQRRRRRSGNDHHEPLLAQP